MAETLDSLKQQTFRDFEVIIIDDGSTDGTAEKIKPYLSDARFKYVYQENAGVGAARNAALKFARGKWFCQLDGDDLFVPTALETFAELSKKDSSANFIYCNMEMFFGNKTQIAMPEDFFSNGDIKEIIYSKWGFPTASVMLSADSLREIGGYKTHFAALEDYDLYLRYAQNGVRAVSKNTVVARYRVLAGGKTSNMVRASKLCSEMVSDILRSEQDARMRAVLKKTYNFHMSRYHLMSAISVGLSDRGAFMSHVVNSIRYRPRRQKRAIIAVLLMVPQSVLHIPAVDREILKLVRGAQDMPWSELED